MSSFFQGTDPDVDAGGAQASAQLAQDWAIKLDGPVQDTSFSSQYHANAAAASANNAAASASASATSAQEAADAAASIGALVLDDLANVDAPSPTTGDVLAFDGTNWVNQPAAVLQTGQAVMDKLLDLESRLIAAGLLT